MILLKNNQIAKFTVHFCIPASHFLCFRSFTNTICISFTVSGWDRSYGSLPNQFLYKFATGGEEHHLSRCQSVKLKIGCLPQLGHFALRRSSSLESFRCPPSMQRLVGISGVRGLELVLPGLCLNRPQHQIGLTVLPQSGSQNVRAF